MKNVTYAEAVAVLELSMKNVRVTVKRKSLPGRGKNIENRAKLPRSTSREKTKRRHATERSRKSRSPSIHWRQPNDHSITAKSPVIASPKSHKSKIVHVPTVHLPVRTKPERVVLKKGQNSNESYGIQLGTRIFIQDIQPNSLADRHGLKRNDTILDINGTTCDNKDINQAVQFIISGSGWCLLWPIK